MGLSEPLEDYFQQPSHLECIARIERLSESGLAMQLEMIRGAMYCKVAGVHSGSAETGPSGQSIGAGAIPTRAHVKSASLEQGARAIVEQLRSRSIRGPRGDIDWLSVGYFQKAGRFQVRLLGDNLFDGRCGIALFLAAYAHVAGDRSSRDLALEVLQPLRQRVSDAKQKRDGSFGTNLTLGSALGLGSLIYSLVKVSHLAGDPALLEEATEISGMLTPGKIAADQEWDVMGGAAGAILSLLALYGKNKEPKILRKAAACGEHLATTRAWYGFSAQSEGPAVRSATVGFAHGTAGICYSLARLYSATNEPSFLQAAEIGLDHERAWYKLSPSRADDKKLAPSGLIGSWCNGIPGIGLARLGCLGTLQGNDIQEEIETALKMTESWPNDGVDHLCCGGFGRAEMLLAAADKLSQPHFRTAARQLAALLMDRAQRAGAYRLFGGSFGSPLFNPSFFQGAAGIGYELLRAAHPEALESVLLWE